MLEQEFENMFADVWFDSKDVSYASEEGIGEFSSGLNTFHTNDALVTISKYDRSLMQNHYSSKRNRLRAQRNSIVSAFGIDMVNRVGYAK